MEINQIILECLSSKGVTQKELALYIGVKANSLNNWLKLGRDIPNRYLMPICKFLNISIEYLLTGYEKSLTIELPVFTKNEHDMLKEFKKLDDRNQLKEIGRLELINQQEAEQTKENVG